MTDKKGTVAPAKRGRPPKDIDWLAVERMCKIQCTEAEIAAIIEVHIDTLYEKCKAQHGVIFPEFFKKHSEDGKMSLRRAQYKKAVVDGHPTMLVWMGKQILGQRDHMEFSNAQPITLAYDPHKLGDGE